MSPEAFLILSVSVTGLALWATVHVMNRWLHR